MTKYKQFSLSRLLQVLQVTIIDLMALLQNFCGFTAAASRNREMKTNAELAENAMKKDTKKIRKTWFGTSEVFEKEMKTFHGVSRINLAFIRYKNSYKSPRGSYKLKFY